MDCAGPIAIRAITGRGMAFFKLYIAVCYTTKSIHLELVSDASTSTFLAALKRFVARRGRPTDVDSDCSSNFLGLNGELKIFLKTAKSRA